jgi:hypothetical protein
MILTYIYEISFDYIFVVLYLIYSILTLYLHLFNLNFNQMVSFYQLNINYQFCVMFLLSLLLNLTSYLYKHKYLRSSVFQMVSSLKLNFIKLNHLKI